MPVVHATQSIALRGSLGRVVLAGERKRDAGQRPDAQASMRPLPVRVAAQVDRAHESVAELEVAVASVDLDVGDRTLDDRVRVARLNARFRQQVAELHGGCDTDLHFAKVAADNGLTSEGVVVTGNTE